jgi:hypothetical protein
VRRLIGNIEEAFSMVSTAHLDRQMSVGNVLESMNGDDNK